MQITVNEKAIMRLREESFRLPSESEVHGCKASRVNAECMAARNFLREKRSGDEPDVGQALIDKKVGCVFIRETLIRLILAPQKGVSLQRGIDVSVYSAYPWQTQWQQGWYRGSVVPVLRDDRAFLCVLPLQICCLFF